MTYFPPPHSGVWTRAIPGEVGLDPDALAAAARWASEHETPWERDLGAMVAKDFEEQPPWNETLGPVRPRGGPSGLVLRGGVVVAEWGDTARADMTFSIAKSYLSILAGLAWDRGLIGDPHEKVRLRVEDGGFDPPHNDGITWQHLLQQTSEWEGVLWGKPDQIDRNRTVGGRPSAAPKGSHRDLRAPGEFWEYNDVRVNRLSLALLRDLAPAIARGVPRAGDGANRRLRRLGMAGLPKFLCRDRRTPGAIRRRRRPLGRRRFYQRARSGADRASCLHRGLWGSRRILSEAWIDRMLEPCPLYRNYGYLWWLNTGRALYPSASARSYYARGAGGNLTWIDPDNEIVTVLRWTDPAAMDGFMKLTMSALEERRPEKV